MGGFKDIILLGMGKSETLKNYTKTIQYHRFRNSNTPNSEPIHKFIIAEYQLHYFKVILTKLQHSVWWNANGFFVVKNTTNPNSCDDAYAISEFMWRLNILSALYVCRDADLKINFYTYNPFTNIAPKYWSEVKKNTEYSENHLILFKNSWNYPGMLKTFISMYNIFFQRQELLEWAAMLQTDKIRSSKFPCCTNIFYV